MWLLWPSGAISGAGPSLAFLLCLQALLPELVVLADTDGSGLFLCGGVSLARGSKVASTSLCWVSF